MFQEDPTSHGRDSRCDWALNYIKRCSHSETSALRSSGSGPVLRPGSLDDLHVMSPEPRDTAGLPFSLGTPTDLQHRRTWTNLLSAFRVPADTRDVVAYFDRDIRGRSYVKTDVGVCEPSRYASGQKIKRRSVLLHVAARPPKYP